MESIVVGDYLGYPYIECDRETAIRFIEKLSERLGFESEDMRDTIRILRNYDEFLQYARRKGKEFVVPSKRESDFIRGRVVVDKIKLLGGGRAMIVFDRRVGRELIEEVSRSIEER